MENTTNNYLSRAWKCLDEVSGMKDLRIKRKIRKISDLERRYANLGTSIYTGDKRDLPTDERVLDHVIGVLEITAILEKNKHLIPTIRG